MRFAPRIARQGVADGVLRLSFDDVHDAVAGRQRAAQNDKACIHQPVHEGGVRGPVGLLLEGSGSIPLRSRATDHDDEHGHHWTLPRRPLRASVQRALVA